MDREILSGRVSSVGVGFRRELRRFDGCVEMLDSRG